MKAHLIAGSLCGCLALLIGCELLPKENDPETGLANRSRGSK
jgi:hypothetical protein